MRARNERIKRIISIALIMLLLIPTTISINSATTYAEGGNNAELSQERGTGNDPQNPEESEGEPLTESEQASGEDKEETELGSGDKDKTGIIASPETQESAEQRGTISSKSKEEDTEEKIEAPKILSISGEIEKLHPSFSPNVCNYTFGSNRPLGSSLSITIEVEKNVTVSLNGKQVQVSSNGKCKLDIPFKEGDSANRVLLKNSENGLSRTYTFHTSGYGVLDPASEFEMYNIHGKTDKNIGEFTSDGSMHYGNTNLSKVKLSWLVNLKESSKYRSVLCDEEGMEIENFALETEVGEQLSERLISSELTLKDGSNVFVLRCYGEKTINGKKEEGIHTHVFHIIRNPMDASSDTKLNGIKIYTNNNSSKNLLTNFDPEIKNYTLTLPVSEFDKSLDKNLIKLSLDVGSDDKKTEVYGGSGIAQNRKLLDGGYYEIASYIKSRYNSADSFSISINVTAPNNLTKDTYLIKVKKEGVAGMLVPDAYKQQDLSIASGETATANIVLSSIAIYGEGGREISGKEKFDNLKIKINDTNVLEYVGESETSRGVFVVKKKNVGNTKVKIIFDNGEYHFEENINATLRYGYSFLMARINEANYLLNISKAEGRVYKPGARKALEDQVKESKNVYKEYSGSNTSYGKNRINDSAIELMDAMSRFKASEIGELITGFEALPAGILNQTYSNAKPESSYNLPSSLVAIIGGEEITLQGIRWESRPAYDASDLNARTYTYSPTLPKGYVCAEGVSAPTITINRQAYKPMFYIDSTLKLSGDTLNQYVYLGTSKSELYFPSHLQSYKRPPNPYSGIVDIPVHWRDNNGYNGNVIGEYTFTAYLDPNDEDYAYSPVMNDNAMQTITVYVIDPDNTSGGGGTGTGGGTGAGDGQGSGDGSGQKQSDGNVKNADAAKSDANLKNSGEIAKSLAAKLTKLDGNDSGGGGYESISRITEVSSSQEELGRAMPIIELVILLIIALGGIIAYRREKKQWTERY